VVKEGKCGCWEVCRMSFEDNFGELEVCGKTGSDGERRE
jgi:hypothetical protein